MKLALLEMGAVSVGPDISRGRWTHLLPLVTGVTKVQVNEMNLIKLKGLDK